MSIEERIKYVGEMSYIEVSPDEIYSWGGMSVCDYCNSKIKDKGYLIFLLNSCVCSNCFEDISKRYKDKSIQESDRRLQDKYQLDYYKSHLEKIDKISEEEVISFIDFLKDLNNYLDKEKDNEDN